MSENIFADDWRDCLRSHYMHVIRTNDRVTEPSLRIVMNQAGFSDAELAEFRVRATMHVDHLDGDFVPDLDALRLEGHEHDAQIEEAPFSIAVPEIPESALPQEPIPDEEQPPAELILDEPPPEDEPPVEDVIPAEPEADDPDAPQQLSLF